MSTVNEVQGIYVYSVNIHLRLCRTVLRNLLRLVAPKHFLVNLLPVTFYAPLRDNLQHLQWLFNHRWSLARVEK